MTTIAYRNGQMAADSTSFIGDIPSVGRTKIWRHESRGRVILFGATGDAVMGEKLRRAIFAATSIGGFNPKKVDPDRDATALIAIREGKRIALWVSAANCMTRLDPQIHQWAVGAGRDYALGAMHHGASAVEAIDAAIALNVWTSGAVHSVTFDGGAG